MNNLAPKLQTIFILGIMPRSGTNYLHNLILSHPECCGGGEGVGEDYLLSKINVLDRFKESVYQAWNSKWIKTIEKKFGPDPLERYLGYGLSTFLQKISANEDIDKGKTEKRPNKKEQPDQIKAFATVTPSVENIDKFFTYFPYAKLIIVVRDGRSVVESGTKSFGWETENAIRRWARAADDIKRFVKENHKYSDQYLVVKYEDLFQSTRESMRLIFSFLGLNPENYDYQSAVNLPVTGSSDLMENGKRMHWKEVARTVDFSPLKRWEKWDRFMHERFNRIAGNQIEWLGYETYNNNSFRSIWKMWNKVLDMVYDIEMRLLWRGYNIHNFVRKIRYFIFSYFGKYMSGRLK